jgi:hypothetical protein
MPINEKNLIDVRKDVTALVCKQAKSGMTWIRAPGASNRALQGMLWSYQGRVQHQRHMSISTKSSRSAQDQPDQNFNRR